MNVGKLAVLVVALFAVAVGCYTREVVVREGPAPRGQPQAEYVEQDGQPAEITVRAAPPAEQVEVVPAAPSAQHTWIRGHWHWNGAEWVWIRGRYRTVRAGWRWVPAHYEGRGGAYYYVPGHWAR